MSVRRRMDVANLRKPRKYLERRYWDLARFGLTPEKLVRRIRGSSAPPVVFTSIPKAGTHLTERLLCLHPYYYRTMTSTISSPDRLTQHAASLSNGQLLCAHIQYSSAIDDFLRERGIKVVFSLRDPRDILVSRAHYIYVTPDHYLHGLALRYPNLRDRIAVLIEGEPNSRLVPYREILLGFAGWLSTDAIVVRFEDLADQHRRPGVVTDVFGRLGIPVDEVRREKIAASTVSAASPTFRRGTSGEWKDVFNESLLRLFHDAVGDILPVLGYREEGIASVEASGQSSGDANEGSSRDCSES